LYKVSEGLEKMWVLLDGFVFVKKFLG